MISIFLKKKKQEMMKQKQANKISTKQFKRDLEPQQDFPSHPLG